MRKFGAVVSPDKIQKERARERVDSRLSLRLSNGAGGADRNDGKLHVYVTRRESLDTGDTWERVRNGPRAKAVDGGDGQNSLAGHQVTSTAPR